MSIDNQIQVVLIDDDPHLRQALCQTLDLAGLKVLPLGEATGLTAQLSRDWPGVVVSDIRMPGMTGLELAKSVLAINPAIKIILVSAYDDFDYARQAIRVGVFDYVEKPIPFRLPQPSHRQSRGENRSGTIAAGGIHAQPPGHGAEILSGFVKLHAYRG